MQENSQFTNFLLKKSVQIDQLVFILTLNSTKSLQNNSNKAVCGTTHILSYTTVRLVFRPEHNIISYLFIIYLYKC